MTRFEAVEITAQQAWFLAEHLHAGSFPWKLAITAPYFDPAERDEFNAKTQAELVASGVIDTHENVKASVAQAIRTTCHASQWLEWLTVTSTDNQQVLRGVLARSSDSDAVVALRYAQMVTFTPMQLTHSEAIVPIITSGLPDDVRPARFNEFELSMDIGKSIDSRIGRGADIVDTLTDLGVPEQDAEIMEIARTGERVTVELTAHQATNGSRHQTDVSVNLISTEVGLILVSPVPGTPRQGGVSVWAPGEPFAIAMAVRELISRLPSGTWFPAENFDI